MTKQEFMAMSLPYGLKVVNVNYFIFGKRIIRDIFAIYHDGRIKVDGVNLDLKMHISAFKPILRPLSDLTKEIENECNKFIPIVELAKMCKVNLKLAGEWTVDESLAQNCVRIQDNYFWYNGDSFLYSILAKKEHKMSVHNQQELLFKLVEWHFDIAGLIDKGEAIDYSALEGFSF